MYIHTYIYINTSNKDLNAVHIKTSSPLAYTYLKDIKYTIQAKQNPQFKQENQIETKDLPD